MVTLVMGYVTKKQTKKKTQINLGKHTQVNPMKLNKIQHSKSSTYCPNENKKQVPDS